MVDDPAKETTALGQLMQAIDPKEQSRRLAEIEKKEGEAARMVSRAQLAARDATQHQEAVLAREAAVNKREAELSNRADQISADEREVAARLAKAKAIEDVARDSGETMYDVGVFLSRVFQTDVTLTGELPGLFKAARAGGWKRKAA